MAQPLALTPTGSVFIDRRGDERALRVSWHTERDVVVLSLWRDNLCAASFRLAADDVPALIEVLAAGLAEVVDHREGLARREATRAAVDPAAGPDDTMPVARPS